MKTGLEILEGIAEELEYTRSWNDLIHFSQSSRYGIFDATYYTHNNGIIFSIQVQLREPIYEYQGQGLYKTRVVYDRAQQEFTKIWNDCKDLKDPGTACPNSEILTKYSSQDPFELPLDNILFSCGHDPEKLVTVLPVLFEGCFSPKEEIVGVLSNTQPDFELYGLKALQRQKINAQLINIDRRFTETGNPKTQYEVFNERIRLKFPEIIPLNPGRILAQTLHSPSIVPLSESILTHVDDINRLNQHITGLLSNS